MTHRLLYHSILDSRVTKNKRTPNLGSPHCSDVPHRGFRGTQGAPSWTGSWLDSESAS